MEGGGFAAARPSIVRKEIGGALAWNRGHLPFKTTFSDMTSHICVSYSGIAALAATCLT